MKMLKTSSSTSSEQMKSFDNGKSFFGPQPVICSAQNLSLDHTQFEPVYGKKNM